MTKKKIMNIKHLRDELLDVFSKLTLGKMGLNQAKETANVAGKIINTAKVQLEYNKYTQSKKEIKFLNSDE